MNGLKGDVITSAVEEDPSAEDKSLRMSFQDSIAGGPYYQQTFDSFNGNVVSYEIDIKMNESILSGHTFYVGLSHDLGKEIRLLDSTGSDMFMSQENEIMPFELNKWYQIKVEINTLTGEYDIYIDGRSEERR